MTQNSFVKEVTMGAGSSYTANGALSYASIGTALLNQFAKAGAARGRDLNTVFAEQSALWAEDPESALKFPFYLRMITRKTKIGDTATTETVQRGQGARDEAFKRMLWIAEYYPEVFYKNLWVLPLVGSWKDLWVLMSMSDTLKREKFYRLIADGIVAENGCHRDLIKKYMPRIRSNHSCKTEWAKKTNAYAKEFCQFVGWTPKEYRQFKSTGKAHEFQRIICGRVYDQLNFKTIPGKALLNLVSGKFLEKHNLTERYLEWLKQQPVAKFNGYPYELAIKAKPYRGRRYGSPTPMPAVLKFTLDKQFANLIETGKADGGGIKGNVWCALDTSGSMGSLVSDSSTVTCFDVCVGLGIYFATLNEGAFHKNVIMFDDKSEVLQLKGEFTDMYQQITSREDAMGSTNFQSVVDEIVRIRKSNPNIPLEDYPSTLLVVSDMQFNPTNKTWEWAPGVGYVEPEITPEEERTNYVEAKRKLSEVFPQEWVDDFKFIWWQVNGKTKDFPSNMDCGGTYNISGFDGSLISFILGGETVDSATGEKVTLTMEEVISNAFNQEVLTFLTL